MLGDQSKQCFLVWLVPVWPEEQRLYKETLLLAIFIYMDFVCWNPNNMRASEWMQHLFGTGSYPTVIRSPTVRNSAGFPRAFSDALQKLFLGRCQIPSNTGDLIVTNIHDHYRTDYRLQIHPTNVTNQVTCVVTLEHTRPLNNIH